VVLRRYAEKPPPHTAIMRLRRERWAYRALDRADAPVPSVLATSEAAGAEALLLTHASGSHLGTVVSQRPPAPVAEAWRSCGRAFAAVHSVDSVMAAGWEQVGISAPEAPRGVYHQDEALGHLARLERARPDLGALDRLRAAVLEAGPLYERAPLALCQFDAHLWQFLVASVGRGWVCTAVLDWENADFDDPDFDLAQLDGFRFAPAGPVPAAFFEGYGRTPDSPLYWLYRLERAAWTLAAHAEGAGWLQLSVPPAERLVRRWAAAAPTGPS